jgi:hypothetical protein
VNSAPVNGPRNSPDTANRAAVAGSDEVTAAANAKGVPIPSRANMTVRAARSVAAGRQVHHSDPNRPPTAMAEAARDGHRAEHPVARYRAYTGRQPGRSFTLGRRHGSQRQQGQRHRTRRGDRRHDDCGRASNFALSVYVAREYGPEAFGVFSLAFITFTVI